jgi:hypothetical protein
MLLSFRAWTTIADFLTNGRGSIKSIEYIGEDGTEPSITDKLRIALEGSQGLVEESEPELFSKNVLVQLARGWSLWHLFVFQYGNIKLVNVGFPVGQPHFKNSVLK